MILNDIRTKHYPEISEEVFWDIIRLDPTYNSEKPQKRGRYAGWLLTLYRQERLKEEDYTDATEYLTVFEANKQRLETKDIGRYRSLPDLYDAVKPYMDTKPVTRNTIKREEATTVYQDKEWTIVVPHTWEAAKLYGAETRWCTSSSYTRRFFDDYTRDADLYINISRKTGRKYQMLVLRDGNKYRYCYDNSDRRVDSGEIGLSRGAADFCNRHFTFDPEVVCSSVRLAPNLFKTQVDIETHALVGIVDGQYQRVLQEYDLDRFDKAGENMLRCVDSKLGRCIIDLDTFEVIPTKACDFCNGFHGDYAVAWKNGMVGVMDRTGHFLPGTEKLSEAADFSWGIAPVGFKTRGYNFIDEQGRLVFDDHFRWCGEFSDGYCQVVFLGGRPGYVSADGKEIHVPDEVYNCDRFIGRVAKVFMNDGQNLLRTDGSFVFAEPVKEIEAIGDTGMYRVCKANGRYTFCDVWTGVFTSLEFLVCKDFVLGLAAVRTPDGLWNFLQTDGTLLLNHGVDWCTDFDRATGLAKISTYRGENYINTDGDLLKPWPALKQKKRLPRGTRVLAA